jgi:hypothetical protein
VRFGKPLDWAFWRVWLAERFGWTFDTIDRLDVMEAMRTVEIVQGHDKALAAEQRKAAMVAGHHRRRR